MTNPVKTDMFFNPHLHSGMNSAYTYAAAVTPTDNVNLGQVARALWIGVAGTIAVVLQDMTTPVTFTVPAGLFPVRASQIFATGTTATSIVALW